MTLAQDSQACWSEARAASRGRLHASPHLAAVLERVVSCRLLACEDDGVGTSPFHAQRAPAVSAKDYLTRLVRHSHCSPAAFVMALLYLDRVAAARPDLALGPLNVHRLLLTSTLLATKYLDDVLYDNAHFAFVGGLDVPELNALELSMLRLLDFRLHVPSADFIVYESSLIRSVLVSAPPSRPPCLLNAPPTKQRPAPPPASPVSVVQQAD